MITPTTFEYVPCPASSNPRGDYVSLQRTREHYTRSVVLGSGRDDHRQTSTAQEYCSCFFKINIYIILVLM